MVEEVVETTTTHNKLTMVKMEQVVAVVETTEIQLDFVEKVELVL